MSKIPTSGHKKLPEKLMASKIAPQAAPPKKNVKVIATRRSGMFNKKGDKENFKSRDFKSKAGPSTSNITTRKRALDSKINETGSTAPKIIKTVAPTVKIAPYDFKARFNNLKEIHVNFKAKHEELAKDYNEIKTKYEEMEKRCTSTDQANENLKKDLLTYKNQLQQFNVITLQNSLLQQKVQDVTVELNEKKKDFSELEQNHLKLKERCKELEFVEKTLESTKAELAATTQKLLNNEELRRTLHNKVQDLKGNIRVFCRCRPQKREESDKAPTNFNYIDEQTIQIHKNESSKFEFSFDKVYPPNSSQDFVFEDLAQLIQSSLDGYNICVFAYGQTGSGKTYTMIGENEADKKGMIPKAVNLLFTKIQELKQLYWEYSVNLSVLEIYNENIKDLLSTKTNVSHEIRYNEGKGISVTNLTVLPINSPSEFYTHMQHANKNRVVAATNFNEHSSRSHAITQIGIQGHNKMSNIHYSSILYLVDLAGSESAKNSQRMTETKAINKSLANLGNVMLALQNKDNFVPYRNSKLTYLLQSALGGNSKTLMFVNVSPLEENCNETLNSLRFASKVRRVTTKSRRCAINNE